MTLPSGEEEEEEEEQEKEVHKTSAMHTAAAAQQWEESMKHLKHALNQCDEETKRFLAPIIKHPAAQQILVSFLSDSCRSFQDWVWEPRAHEVLARFRSTLLERAAQEEGEAMATRFTWQLNMARGKTSTVEATAADALLKEAAAKKEEAKNRFLQRDYGGALKVGMILKQAGREGGR
ncbi:Hypothetical protein NocV09_00800170, partial [Nannochloropsis oceanica]